MKKAIALMVVALLASGAQAKGGGRSSFGHVSTRSSGGEHYTVGHTTKNGEYVTGHYSTNPNSTRNDNYSTRGNVNPHTGEAGTKPRDGETPY